MHTALREMEIKLTDQVRSEANQVRLAPDAQDNAYWMHTVCVEQMLLDLCFCTKMKTKAVRRIYIAISSVR